jgi:aspartyl aminopeptidase
MNEKQIIEGLLDFIDQSPSPYHAVKNLENQLINNNFAKLDEKQQWTLNRGGRYYVIRDDSSIIFFIAGEKPLSDSGYKILGAHTDSPGLKIKPNPVINTEGLLRLGVEIYGGPILATFTDRDLSLAGRFSYKTSEQQIDSQLVQFEQPLLRLPNLAIHMNRTVNEEGLKLHKQNELALIISTAIESQLSQKYLTQLLEQASDINADDILSWELNVYDTQKGSFWGDKQQFYADSQLDNLASCHVGAQALLNNSALKSGNTNLCAFFDHEEIGSESTKGADGSFLPDILERIALALELN